MSEKDQSFEKIRNLPICSHLENICSELKHSESRFLILTAETAAGKSTGLPLALMKEFPGKIFMLEPRRLAVLAIAERIASLKNEKPGESVGYRIHLESKISEKTKLEIITEAILTRQLQNDPSLEGTSVVILDEFHERSIHSDLALAFLKESMELREDLFVIVMSATINTEKLSAFLGSKEKPAPVYKVPGRQFPVEIEYKEKESWTAIYDEALNCKKGTSILGFFPGIADIRRCESKLREMGLNETAGFEVMILHSSISLAQQREVLSKVPENIVRIILSSAIAETSLTVPGVSIVVDTGLCRMNKMNIAAGLEQLVTVQESEFSAQQRAGRAGRLGKGRCVRLWNKYEKLSTETLPEILRTDISALVLECAQWGVLDKKKLSWLDEPGEAAWSSAKQLLLLLGCIDEKGITDIGKAALQLGLHPRIACVALSGFPELAARYAFDFDKISSEMQKRYIQDIKGKLESVEKKFFGKLNLKTDNKNLAILSGFPDRLAHGGNDSSVYQFPSGRTALINKCDAERQRVFPEWIVATKADAGEKEGIIYEFVEIDKTDGEKWLSSRTTTKIVARLEGKKILKYEETSFGRIILKQKKLNALPEDFSAALMTEIHEKGISVLPFSEECRNFIVRAAFYRQQKWEEKSEEIENAEAVLERELSEKPEEWLLPFLGGKTSVSQEDVYNGLKWFLNEEEINRNAPARITLPNGKNRKISYEKQSLAHDKTKLVLRPVLEIIIQQIFGCLETPKVMGMPVLLRLLSPAQRPLQVTDDLSNFWVNTWPEICKEMKGRYPKHNWNYKEISKD